ncbi:NAD(P)-dependent oxidoreductase [Sphingobacterium suaedae]|uniref:NAD(P)-dependent oxidoreductase n=1 Tax=Sphingobacterium suaedae TaxID=1686402 RepID=A0ABW5KCV4_9SPHI
MKKIALIGATGFVGFPLLEELIARGYHVLAIARDVQQLKNKEQVTAIQVDVNEEVALAAALKGCDVVISAFNAGWDNPSLYDDFMRGSRSILLAVKDAHVKRFIVVGGAGSLLINGKKLVDDPKFPKHIKAGAQAASDYLEVIKREHDLSWTFFSPAINMGPDTPGSRTGKYRTDTDTPVFDSSRKSQISVEDAAVAIVDEIETERFINKRFTAGY